MTVIDMVGKRFGRLVVVKYSHTEREKRRYICKCDCGRETLKAGIDMRRGQSKSCGCTRGDSLRKFNKTKRQLKRQESPTSLE